MKKAQTQRTKNKRKNPSRGAQESRHGMFESDQEKKRGGWSIWWPVRATTCSNFIFSVQTLFSSYKLSFRKELIRKESGNKREYFKMVEGKGDKRDVIEHYFHLGYTNEIILEFLKCFHHIRTSLRTLKRRLHSFGLRRKGNIIDEARIRAIIIRELSGLGQLQFLSVAHVTDKVQSARAESCSCTPSSGDRSVCFYAKKTKTVDQEAVLILWPKFLRACGW